MEASCPPTNEIVCHLLQLCNTTQKNIPYYCWQEKTDGTDRFHPGVSLVSVSEQMSLYFLKPEFLVHQCFCTLTQIGQFSDSDVWLSTSTFCYISILINIEYAYMDSHK